jgi:phenylacetate-CoA ligase
MRNRQRRVRRDPAGRGCGARSTAAQALARLPVTRKHELLERQQAQRPPTRFGGFSTRRLRCGDAARVCQPGADLRTRRPPRKDYWRMARAMFAAGFRPGELIHNCFSYHFVPAGSMMETGAHALGCTVFAGGTGQTEQQVQAMAELRPAGYIGTPSFLKIIVEKAAEMGVPLPSVTKACSAARPFRPACATGSWPIAASRATSVLPPPTWG